MNVPTRKRILLMLISVMVLLAGCGSTGPQDMRDSARAFAENQVLRTPCYGCGALADESVSGKIRSADEIYLTADDLARGITEKWCYEVEVSFQRYLDNGGLGSEQTEQFGGIISYKTDQGVASERDYPFCSFYPLKKDNE